MSKTVALPTELRPLIVCRFRLVRAERFELSTTGFQNRDSTPELRSEITGRGRGELESMRE